MPKIKQKTLLGDYETKIFKNLQEMMDFLKEQAENDVWKRCYIKEIRVKPVENNPICIQQIRQDVGISENVPDDSVTDCMADMKLALTFPYDTLETYPLRYTAYSSISDRAGISGRSISTFMDKCNQKEMPPQNKAQIFNWGLELYGSRALVLVRDNKVSAVLSGDENDYSILITEELANILIDNLSLKYPNFAFKAGFASHEYTSMTFNLNTAKVEREFLRLTSQHGLSYSRCNAQLKFFTADVGMSAVKLMPMMETDKGIIPIGTPMSLAHKNKANTLQFEKMFDMLMPYYEESLKKVEKLTTIKIKYPAGCLRAVAHFLNMPKKASLVIADQLENMGSCSAYMIYWYLNQILSEHEATIKKPLSETSKLRLIEDMSKAIMLDYSNFDHPFQWPNLKSN